MLRSPTVKALLMALLGVLFVMAAMEPVVSPCTDDDDDGAMCYCLCTQALETPDTTPVVQSPVVSLVAARPSLSGFHSLTFRPPTPPPQA